MNTQLNLSTRMFLFFKKDFSNTYKPQIFVNEVYYGVDNNRKKDCTKAIELSTEQKEAFLNGGFKELLERTDIAKPELFQ